MQHAAIGRSWVALVPSALSAMRIATAAAFPLDSSRTWRATVILIAGLSDMTDGYVARRLGVASVAGGQLDAITDKIFALSVLVTFLAQGTVQPWEVALLLSRDLVVTCIAVYAVATRQWIAFRRMPPRLPGKITTASLFALFLVIVVRPSSSIEFVAFTTTVLFSFAAAIDYFIQFLRAYTKTR